MTSLPPGADRGAAITGQRLLRQRLIGPRFVDPIEAVSWFGAVQAQDFAGACWGIGQRCDGVTDANIRRLFDDGGLLRTHVMRPTWHFVAPADLRWLLAATATQVHAVNAPYYRKTGLGDRMLRSSADAVAAALTGGKCLTRTELAAVLERSGIIASGLRLALIVMYCELEAVICSGPIKGRLHTYALLDERVPPAPPLEREAALDELAKRYFASHGPAEVADFAWWSGLRVTQARAAVERADVDTGAGDGVKLPPRRPTTRLLPNYDEYVVAYQDRSAFAPPAEAGVDRMSILSTHAVVRDGRIVGSWKRTIERGAVRIAVFPYAADDARLRHGVLSAASAYGRFLALPVEVEFHPSLR